MMQFTYKLLLIGSMLFMSACSTNLAPRGWKKVNIQYKTKHSHIDKSHKKKMSKAQKKHIQRHIQIIRKKLTSKKQKN